MSGRPAQTSIGTPAETVDEIDAAVDAIADDEIGERLNGLLAQLVGGPTRDEEDTRLTQASLLAKQRDDRAIELESLLEALHAANRELRAVQSQVIAAKARRDELNRAANLAQARLVQARRQLAEAAPGTVAYLDAVSTRSQEILDVAHRAAQDIIRSATARANVIRGRSDLKDGQLSRLGGATFDHDDRKDQVVRGPSHS
jgi:hypothetical protein